jgi:hypothetical protein
MPFSGVDLYQARGRRQEFVERNYEEAVQAPAMGTALAPGTISAGRPYQTAPLPIKDTLSGSLDRKAIKAATQPNNPVR